MRQEIGKLVEQVEAHRLVLDGDMNVHAADEQPARHDLHVPGDRVVALLVGVHLDVPVGEGMRRGGDRRHAVTGGRLGNGAAETGERGARLGERAADRRADLDLATQEFAGDIVSQRRTALGHQPGGRIDDKVAAFAVDEEIFLLDANGEARLLHGRKLSENRASGNGVGNGCNAHGIRDEERRQVGALPVAFACQSVSRRARLRRRVRID